jgi:hypothetical protein
VQRLGAPAVITWQKLLFDKDCCAQAFRLLLTRIKSSRRISSRGNNGSGAEATAVPTRRRPRQHSDTSSARGEDEEDPESSFAYGGSEVDPSESSNSRRTGPIRLSGALDRVRRLPPKRSVTNFGDDWNFDTSSSVRDDDQDSNQTKRDPSSLTGPGIVIERSVSVKQSSGFAAKFKKNQLQVLQHENSALSEENARLRQEIEHLESLVAILQGTHRNADAGSVAAFDVRRTRLLQAQNVQLQRQVSLLQDAMIGCQQAEASLVSALHHWRDVVEAAQQDAAIAGADVRGASKNDSSSSEPAKWMFAVPQRLMTELTRVEEQIHGASTAVGSTYESKLRVGDRASGFLRDNQTSLSMSELYGSDRGSLRQLKPGRLKILEDQLAKVARDLEEFSSRVLQNALSPKIISQSVEEEDGTVAAVIDLISSVQDLLLDIGAFGVVVATSSASLLFDSNRLPVIEQGLKTTVPQIIKALGPTSTANVRERDKHVKVMLKQLQACYSSLENDAKMCRREAGYWKNAWKMQAGMVRDLVHRVDRLGHKKLAWIQENTLPPMIAVAQVFESFQRAHQEGTTRQNPYLPLLIETLTAQQDYVRGSVDQWERYDRSTRSKLDALVADFEANADALETSLLQAHRST